MLSKYAKEEYEDTIKYKHMLSKIPNYKDYFLVDGFSMCEPAPLTKRDLKHYKTKCRALQKRNVTKKNVNERLSELRIINMPYGGEDLGDYMESNRIPSDLATMNDAMIGLLKNGIIPMNELGVYHLDIKESNILIDVRNPSSGDNGRTLVKLIDWGLSSTYNKEADYNIPDTIVRRSFQYNAPMSIALFTHKFGREYAAFLETTQSPDFDAIAEFVSKYLIQWFEERGAGHFITIHEILQGIFKHKMTSKNKSKEEKDNESPFHYLNDVLIDYTGLSKNEKYMLSHDVITEYLTEILMQYTYNGEFHVKQYFDDIFIKNVDIWGFIMSYCVVLEAYYANYVTLNKDENLVYDKLRSIFVKYLFASPLVVIDTEDLFLNLTELSKLWRNSSFLQDEIALTKESAFSIPSVNEAAEREGVTDTKESEKVINALIEKR
jgi:serine/threonine protein kinase